MRALCPVCTVRETRGYGYQTPRRFARDAPRTLACSMACLDVLHHHQGDLMMIDPTPNERAAFDDAGAAGGQYLESIGKTDLATLDGEEWRTFLEAIITGYGESLRNAVAADQSRLERLAS